MMRVIDVLTTEEQAVKGATFFMAIQIDMFAEKVMYGSQMIGSVLTGTMDYRRECK